MTGLIATLRRSPALAMFVRFIAVGGANTMASLVIYWLALQWMPPQVAYAISFAFGVVIGYLLHTRYAFRVSREWRSFAAWPLICLAGWLVGASVLQLAIGPLGVDARVAPLMSIAASLPVTFLLGRRLFGPNRRDA